jgi:hypothetical protein
VLTCPAALACSSATTPSAGAQTVCSAFTASEVIGELPSDQNNHAHLRLLTRFLPPKPAPPFTPLSGRRCCLPPMGQGIAAQPGALAVCFACAYAERL